MKAHTNGASYHNRYPYSGKIICQVHSATFHRQLLKSRQGKQEVWQCKVYRQNGRAACSAPQLCSEDLDLIMAQIFTQVVKDKNTIIDAVIAVLKSIPQEADCSKAKLRIEEEMKTIHIKKDRLLELSIADALTVSEFKKRNGSFNQQLEKLEAQLAAVEAQQKNAAPDWKTIHRELERELTFQEKINTALVATILEKITVKKFEIPTLGLRNNDFMYCEVHFRRKKSP